MAEQGEGALYQRFCLSAAIVNAAEEYDLVKALRNARVFRPENVFVETEGLPVGCFCVGVPQIFSSLDALQAQTPNLSELCLLLCS